MEMKEIVYNKSCNVCGSEKLQVTIEYPDDSITGAWAFYAIITFKCAECGQLVEKIEIYAEEAHKPCKVQVAVNQDVEDIFDATKEEELKCELANAKAELATVKGNLEFVEKDLDKVYTERNTYKALLMDIYKLSNKGGSRNG